MQILTEEIQQELRATRGELNLTRFQLSKELGLSLPTTGKIINSSAPMVVSNTVFNKVIEWIKTKEAK
ncbi:hypothetical protein [Limosilactobacillus equigenerosi]|uniref:HTH cro/C1-type domain-containing protein n=1 Tax=Limosilactobacillus equigenerosi DSM 18793 = JCM 14505 TaxID=1423742 RepID=A0A0R1UTN3_9LACO|nr:hypothetical protein [Limosilactobacillus equigenerosi]KRL96544.1 hypothetical protein FC21_GL000916 [Limosilactobacillus equigenerosi DSM 18793 = JCM 14505]